MPPIPQVTTTVTNPLDQDIYKITTSDGYFAEFEDYQTPVGAIIGSGEPVLRIDNSGITIPPSGTFELSPTATIETAGADGSLYRIQTYLTNENSDLSQNRATLIQRLDGSGSVTQQTLAQTNLNGRITQISSIGTDGRVVGYSPTSSAIPTVEATGLTDINAIVARQMPGAILPSPALSTPTINESTTDRSTPATDDPTSTPRAITVDPTTTPATDPTSNPDRSTPDGSTPATDDPTTTPRAITVDPTTDGSTPGRNESTTTPAIDPTTTPAIDPTTTPAIDPTTDRSTPGRNESTTTPAIDPTTDRSTPGRNESTTTPAIDPTTDRSTPGRNESTTTPAIDPTTTPAIDPTTTPRAITVDPTTDGSTPGRNESTTTPAIDPTTTPAIDGSTPGRNESTTTPAIDGSTPILSTPDGRLGSGSGQGSASGQGSTPTSIPDGSTPDGRLGSGSGQGSASGQGSTPTSTAVPTTTPDGGSDEEEVFFDAQEFIDELDNCPPGEELDYEITSPPDLDNLNNSTVFDGQPPQFRNFLESQVPLQPEIDRGDQLGQAAFGFLTVLNTAAIGIAGIANDTCKFAIAAANITTPLIGNTTTTEAPDALAENSQASLSTSAIVGIGAAVTLVASVAAAYKMQQMRKQSRNTRTMNSVEPIGDPQERASRHLGGPPSPKFAWPEATATRIIHESRV